MNCSKLALRFRSILHITNASVFLCAFTGTVSARQLPSSASPLSQKASRSEAHYVGSESCKTCHLAAYNGWKKSRMANILLDPRQHPEAVVGDFSKPDPVRTFSLDDVAFTYGGRFKQRYFTKRGDDYFPLPAQWDVAKAKMASLSR